MSVCVFSVNDSHLSEVRGSAAAGGWRQGGWRQGGRGGGGVSFKGSFIT